MHACTKGLVCFAHFFFFYVLHEPGDARPEETKEGSLLIHLVFLSVTVARVHIFTCTVHPFIVSTVYYYIGIAYRVTTLLPVFKPVSTASPHSFFSFLL